MSDQTPLDHGPRFDPFDQEGPSDIHPEDIELEKIPRRLWEATLAPLHLQHRIFIAHKVRDERLREAASNLAVQLDIAQAARRNERLAARGRAGRAAAPLPSPRTGHPTARDSVQVNIRLRADDHAMLVQAASNVGLRPTTLARALVLNGAAQVLRDRGAT